MAINIDASRKKQDEGVWTDFDGSRFKIVHTGTNRFQRALTRLQAPYRRKIDKGTLDPAISRKLLCQAMAEGLLLGWEDVVDASGAAVPFTEEVAVQALMNNDDLREFLTDFAGDLENFRTEQLAEAAKS